MAADSAQFEIGADGVDAVRLVDEIRAAVARKMASGDYRDARIARAERANLAHLRDNEQFLSFYLECLRHTASVDIGDFEIRERRRLGGSLLVALERVIWKLLKFYTYRLWSQQNQVNGLLVSTLEGLDEQHRQRIQNLEERVKALESGARSA